eukprot:1016186-Prymnesium_polylepis.2
MDECHPIHARGELGNAQEIALALVLRPATVREDKDALEAELLVVVLSPWPREDAPNIGSDDALAVLDARRVGDNEDVHVAARRVLTRACAERLVVVLGGEVCRDAHLVLAEGGIGQVALMDGCRAPVTLCNVCASGRASAVAQKQRATIVFPCGGT